MTVGVKSRTVGVKSSGQYDCHITHYFSHPVKNDIHKAQVLALNVLVNVNLIEAQLQCISNTVMYHYSCISLARVSNSSSISKINQFVKFFSNFLDSRSQLYEQSSS